MKHLYIALLASAALTTACSDYNDQFEGLKEGHHAVDIKKKDYTLTADDYKAIAEDAANKALAKKNGEADELAALAKTQQFTEKITSKEYLPAFLAKKWFTADNGSAIKVTFNSHETYGLDLGQDFESAENKAVQPAALKKWQTLTTLGDEKAAWSTQFRNEAHYLQASAYNQKDSVQTYLVSPVFTISKGSKLTFDALYGHYVEKGGRLSVFLYDGDKLTQEIVPSRQPLADLTNQVNIEIPAAGQKFGTFKQAINADLSQYAGKQVQLALRYDGNGKTKATTTVQVDNLVVGANVTVKDGAATEQYVLSKNKWVFDPSTVVTLGARGDKPTQAFYQSIVNWVKEKKGAEYIEARGNAESYSGISAYYNNIDFSATTVRKNTPAAFKDVKDADIPALLQKNIYETLAAGLSLNYADAVPVQGVEVIYTVKFMVYDGATKNYEVKFKVIGKGQFEPIAKSLKEVK